MNIDRVQSSIATVSAVQPASAIVRGVSIGDGRRFLRKPRSDASDTSNQSECVDEAPVTSVMPYALSPAELMANGGLSAHEHGFQAGYQEGLRRGREDGETAGRQAGFEQGWQEAESAVLRDQENAIRAQAERASDQHQRLDRWLDSLAEQQANLLDKHIDDLLALCFDAVSRVVGQLTLEPEQLIELIRSVLQHADTFSSLCVRLHPDDLNLVQSVMSRSPETLSTGLVLKADHRVKLGGAILQSDQGTLDARLEVQMARFARFLIEQRERRQASEGDK